MSAIPHRHDHEPKRRAGASISFVDLTLGYDRHPAVHHLNGTIEAGSLLAIVGPNGAGKSTLLKGIVGAIAPLNGRVAIRDGDSPVEARARLAYLPQVSAIDHSFPICVFDLVATGLWRTTGLFGGIGRKDRDAVDEAIAAVGLTGFERREIGKLSGGQLQRALFARLLLQDADIILLDEPLTAIDSKTAADLLDLVRRWHSEHRTVVAVLHDMALVRETFPQTLMMARELVAFGRTADVLTPENLLAARRMIEAFDEGAHVCAVEDSPRMAS
ncbi:MAG: transporter [Hyphomicrobiales bacterium]|jgi:zinc/manganese transport system ATP-binding protein|nr:transporter [Hyphomicrobiales bacterium]